MRLAQSIRYLLLHNQVTKKIIFNKSFAQIIGIIYFTIIFIFVGLQIPNKSFASNVSNLYQIQTNGTTAMLYFTPISEENSGYVVSYGFHPNAEDYEIFFSNSNSKGAVTYSINDLFPGTWYFKVRGQNGSMPESWSNIMRVKITASGNSLFTWNYITQQLQDAATQRYTNFGWYLHNRQSMQYVNGLWYTTPFQYQNYGWYPTSIGGQSMQYLDGSWYTTPQQSKPQSPSSNVISSSSISQTTILTPTPTPQTTNCGASPSSCGFPDATNTGPVGCSSYTQMSGATEITTDNEVINCVKMTNGAFDIYANNVTIKNSIIQGNDWWAINLRSGYSGLTVQHDTITGVVGQGPDNGGEDYAIAQSGSGPIEIGGNNISEFGDAISIGDGNVHDNYVHDLQSFIPLCGGSPCSYYQHTDDFITDGLDSVGLTIRHNTMFNQMSPDLGASAAIGLFADNGPVSNATVDDNLLAGGAYALYPGGGSTSSNIVITNNHFSTIYWPQSGFYGPDATTNWHTGSGNEWSGNIWDDGPNIGQMVNP